MTPQLEPQNPIFPTTGHLPLSNLLIHPTGDFGFSRNNNRHKDLYRFEEYNEIGYNGMSANRLRNGRGWAGLRPWAARPLRAQPNSGPNPARRDVCRNGVWGVVVCGVNVGQG